MSATTNSVTLDAVMAEARTWIGTPYHEHACVRGVGVDCAMLLVGMARNLGLVDPTWTPDFYSPQWHLHQHDEQYCHIMEAQGATRLTLGDQQPGHILLFRWQAAQPASHAAILMPDGMIIHAVAAKNPRKALVRHEPLARFYLAHLAYVYAWPEGTA